VQRVHAGSVTVEGAEISRIGCGVVVLVGISRTDSIKEAQSVAQCLISLPVFWDAANNKWDSLETTKNEVLLISQFTLCAVFKGRKPDFHNAMTPKEAQPLYDQFVGIVRRKLGQNRLRGMLVERFSYVSDGRFGAMMKVEIQNDGFTTQIDSTDL